MTQTQAEREDFDVGWFFMTHAEQVEHLEAWARGDLELPPLGTEARSVHDRADAFARAVVAHRILRRAVQSDQKARVEADRLLTRARAALDHADAAGARADALVDVLIGDRA